MSFSEKISAAREQGYSDDEISQFLSEKDPDLKEKAEKAQSQGYSSREVIDFLEKSGSQNKKYTFQNPLRTVARLAGQNLIGQAERATMNYNLPVIGIQGVARNPPIKRSREVEESQKETLNNVQESRNPLENQLEQKFRGSLEEQENYEKENTFVPDWVRKQGWDVGSLIETAFKGAGIDMRPENAGELAVRWAGSIKDIKKINSLSSEFLKATKDPKRMKQVLQNFLPSPKELAQGFGAATALNVAAENELGPLGTLTAGIVGHTLGGGALAGVKQTGEAIRHPVETGKKLVASAATKLARLNGKEKLNIQKDLIKSFREAGIQADLGTLTDSNLIKYIQARLSQSGLVGGALDELKTNITNDVVGKYKQLADQLGEAKFGTLHEAGEALQETTTKIRDLDLAETRKIYEDIRTSAKDPNAQVHPDRLLKEVQDLEAKLTPGSVKSSEQNSALESVRKLKSDLVDENGNLKLVSIQDLMNNKIALNDIINYEVQGGSKQLLKPLTSEIDRTILQYGRKDPGFANKYIEANKRFSAHAKTFRNQTVSNVLRGKNPSSMMSKMNTVQGIRDIKNSLSKTPEGRELFKNLSRFKFDQIVFNNMIDGATNQLKMGKFSNILEKGNNRAIIQELMGNNAYKRLVRLQSATGKIAESAQKFFNSSKSGAVAIDAAIILKFGSDLVSLFHGNPWPLVRTGGGVFGARYLSKLLADPEFLKMVEESILDSTQKNPVKFAELMKNIESSVKSAILETGEDTTNQSRKKRSNAE